MEGISNEVVLRCLLSRIKVHSKKQHNIFNLLIRKVKYGHLIDADAEKYCIQQGWLERKMCSEPWGDNGNKYWHELVVTELGLQQIPILWGESKLNPKNIWIGRMKYIPWILGLLALSLSNTILSAICDVVEIIVAFCSNYVSIYW